MNQNRYVYIICTEVVALKVGCLKYQYRLCQVQLFFFSHKEEMVDILHRKEKLQSLYLCLAKSHHYLEYCKKVFDVAHRTKEVFCFALESARAEDWLLHLCLPKGLLNDRSHISKQERYERYSEFYILCCFF